MKKILSIVLALVMLFGLVACGNKAADNGTNNNTGTNNPATTDGDTNTTPDNDKTSAKRNDLVVAFTQDRGTLDPCYMIGYDGLNAIRMMYEGLWEWDQEGNQTWILATGIDFVSDTCWHIHVREGIKFTNGNPLTAEDVMFSIDKANHRTGEPDYLPNLESMRVVDEYTVELNFTQYDLSYVYSMTSLMIFDKESYDADDIAINPNGTGPYKLDDYVVNSHITMSLKDDYWGEMPTIEKMTFRVYAEESQMTNAIITGEVDVCNVPFQDIEYVQDSGVFNVEIAPATQGLSRALYFNTTEFGGLCENELGRQAIAMAIDTEAILNIAYNGYGSVAVMPCSVYCVDADESYYNQGVYAEGYNPEKAAKIAEEAGIVGKTFTISTNGTADAILCAELIQADLEAIGVHIEINNYDTGSWLSVAFVPEAAGDMFIDSTGVPSKTVSQNISCWYLYHLGGGFTRSVFSNKDRLDEISAVIMSISDESERASMNAELVDIESNVLHWFNMVDRVSAAGYAKGLEGYQIMLMGNVDYSKLHWVD